MQPVGPELVIGQSGAASRAGACYQAIRCSQSDRSLLSDNPVQPVRPELFIRQSGAASRMGAFFHVEYYGINFVFCEDGCFGPFWTTFGPKRGGKTEIFLLTPISLKTHLNIVGAF